MFRISCILFLVLAHFKMSAQTTIPFRDGDIWYYVTEDGQRVSDKTYQFATPFMVYEGNRAVKFNDKFGFIDTKERFLFEPKFDSTAVINGRLRAYQDGKSFNVDINGNRVWGEKVGCGPAGSAGTSLNRVFKRDGKMGVYYEIGGGDTIIPAIYDSISIPYGTDVIILFKDGKYGICNREWKYTVPINLDKVEVIKNGGVLKRVAIYRDGKVGAVNLVGDVIIMPKYTNVHYEFSPTFYTILENGKVGYIYKGKEYWKD